MNELISIDDPQIRQSLAEKSGVTSLSGITVALCNEPFVMLGNYIRTPDSTDDSPNLLPTVLGLEYISWALSEKDGPNRLLAVARKSIQQNPPQGHEIITPAIIPAEKIGGEYQLINNGSRRLLDHLTKNGIVWIAPGATTDYDGFVPKLNAGGIIFAQRTGAHVCVAAMVTEDTPTERIVTQIYVKEVDIPTVIGNTEPTKLLIPPAYLAITRYAMAEAASLIPDGHERGNFSAYENIKHEVCETLRELEKQGLFIDGGFYTAA